MRKESPLSLLPTPLWAPIYLKNKVALPQIISSLNIGGLYGLFIGIKKNSEKRDVLNVGSLCGSFFGKCTLTFDLALITCNHSLMGQNTKKDLVSTQAASRKWASELPPHSTQHY